MAALQSFTEVQPRFIGLALVKELTHISGDLHFEEGRKAELKGLAVALRDLGVVAGAAATSRVKGPLPGSPSS